MQCFICVTYMLVMGSALPPAPLGSRSLFRDVMSSLLRDQPPGNRLPPDNRLPADKMLLPRRNDRLKALSLSHRLPKAIVEAEAGDATEPAADSKEEIVLYVTTETHAPTTKKPGIKKNTKRPRPTVQKNKNKNKNVEGAENEEQVTEEGGETLPDETSALPLHNNMSGQSQIGNRESQIVVKPTVIVNFRGTVSHRDSDIRLEGRRAGDNRTEPAPDPAADPARNVFNINQEITLDRTIGDRRGQTRRTGGHTLAAASREEAGEVITVQQKQIGRSVHNVFEILVTL